MESSLKGLQVELSETCALCLSRLLSLIRVPHVNGPQLSDAAKVSPSSDKTVQPILTSQLHLLFKLDCRLEDVNVFTLSNLAGKKLHRGKKFFYLIFLTNSLCGTFIGLHQKLTEVQVLIHAFITVIFFN